MIKNAVQHLPDRWLSFLLLLAVTLITFYSPAQAQYQTYYDFHSEWLFPPVHDRCTAPLPANAICSYPSPDEVRFRNYIKTIVYRWMAERKLAPEDLEGVIYKYGRRDLTADIQAYVAADLLLSLEKPVASRAPDEQFVVSYFEREFASREWYLYNHAVQVGESWQNDPCSWKPDADLAAAYGLVYDSTPYCRTRQSVFVTASTFHIPGPKSEYLYAAGFKEIYGGGSTSAMMLDRVAVHLGAFATGVTGGGVAGGVVARNISKITPYARAVHDLKYATDVARLRYLRYTRLLSGGAFSIVTMMVEIGIEGIIAVAESVKFQQDLDSLRATRERLGGGQDTIAAVTSEEGLAKAMIIMARYTSMSSVDYFKYSRQEPLPAHRPGVDRVFLVREGGTVRPAEFLEINDHAGLTWRVHTWQNWFVRRTTVDGQNVESITTDLDVTDHNGIKWTLTRVGPDRFRMTQVRAPENAEVCPSVNGISSRSDGMCSVYFNDNVNIELAGGIKVNLHVGIAPTIESNSFFFPAGVETSRPIQVTGIPTPAVQVGGRPAWLRLSNGALIGNPGSAAGKSVVTADVKTESGTSRKDITIYYGQPVQFMSPAALGVMATERVAFTIDTAGTPRPKITMTGWLPPFLSFSDNGNGTATISGLWAGGIAPVCIPVMDSTGKWSDCGTTIIADNGAQRVEQRLTLSFSSQPVAVFKGPTELKFVAGVESRYLLTTGGARTPVEWRTLQGHRLRDEMVRTLPWLRFDERPDGTAMVYGIPPMNGQSSSDAFTACPFARGSQYANCGAVGNLKVHVDAATRFMSDPVGSVIVGKASAVQVFVNRLSGDFGFSPHHILTSRFPKGLRIEPAAPQGNGMVTARILGSAEAGQGGRYEFMLNWTDQLTSVNSLFRLDVLEPASITGPDTFTFFEGSNAAGEVATQGYPVNSANVDCGPGKDCGDMSIRMEWVQRRIEGLTLTNRSGEGVATSVGRFEGAIPTGSSGIYEAILRASNGRMAPAFAQRVKLVVLPTADLNNDGKVDCLDLTAMKDAIGTVQPGPGRGFDVTGDMLTDDKDINAMVRAVPELCTCQI